MIREWVGNFNEVRRAAIEQGLERSERISYVLGKRENG